MRCGNCKQEHASIREVRDCYRNVGRTAVPQRLTKTVTERQTGFINQLLEQTGQTEADLQMPVEQMTFQFASDTIVALKEKRATMSRDQAGQSSLPASIQGPEVPQGTYTVVWEEKEDVKRITLRFRAPRHGKWANVQLVEYLYGPNNESDFRRCANRTDGGYRVWYSFREDSKIIAGIQFMMDGKVDRQAAGMTYAMESGNCYRCGRTLTVPASIHRGLGPECAQIVARA